MNWVVVKWQHKRIFILKNTTTQ